MDKWTLQEEAFHRGYEAGKHEKQKTINELIEERNYFMEMSTDLHRSVRGMRAEIEHLRNQLEHYCERCPNRADDEWD